MILRKQIPSSNFLSQWRLSKSNQHRHTSKADWRECKQLKPRPNLKQTKPPSFWSLVFGLKMLKLCSDMSLPPGTVSSESILLFLTDQPSFFTLLPMYQRCLTVMLYQHLNSPPKSDNFTQ